MPIIADMPYDAKREFRRRRIRLGLEMKEVAQQVPVSYSALRSFEVGLRPIKVERIYRLAELLNIPVDEVEVLLVDAPTNEAGAA